MMIVGAIKARIAFKNFIHKMLPHSKIHPSGYKSGDSPHTDILAAVDHAGRVVGHVNRGCAHANGILHAAVHVLLFSPRGKILVQMRGWNKDSSPGKLSQSVGGHVALGYTPEETVRKECAEELGVLLGEFQLITKYSYESKAGKNQELVYLYRTTHRGPVRPNYTEVAWAAFFGLNGIRTLADREPHRFAPSFLQDLRYM